MKYGDWTMGQTEALINKLGGLEVALDILRGVVEVVTKMVSYLTITHKDTVNYDRSIVDLVKDKKDVCPDFDIITDDDFPSKEKGTRVVEFGLFHFNHYVFLEDVKRGMRKEGFRPATMKELLVYGNNHPEDQRQFPIVAPGSIVVFNCHQRVGCLDGCYSERSLILYYCDDGWLDHYRFLAVRI